MTVQHPQVNIVQHALVQQHLAGLRSTATRAAAFRQHLRVLSTLLAAEATRDLPLAPVQITTPMESTTCYQLNARVALVPILRAGLGMVEPLIELLPELEVWHLGLYRDEATAEPVHYYDKLPAADPADLAIVVDPMLATGGSASLAISALQRWGVPRIVLLSVISTPEGVQRVLQQSPQVAIWTCALDRGLNDRKFILPGLGDAGDRIFNT